MLAKRLGPVKGHHCNRENLSDSSLLNDRPSVHRSGRCAGVTADSRPPEAARDGEQGRGEGPCPEQNLPTEPARQRLSGHGHGESHRHEEGEREAQPPWINADRPSASLVHALENHQDVLDPDEPETERRQDQPEAVDDNDTGEERDSEPRSLPERSAGFPAGRAQPQGRPLQGRCR